MAFSSMFGYNGIGCLQMLIKYFEKRKEKLKNNKKFWVEKIEENISRDSRNDVLLKNIGWIPLHFWSKDVENHLDECIREILEYVSYQTNGKTIE